MVKETELKGVSSNVFQNLAYGYINLFSALPEDSKLLNPKMNFSGYGITEDYGQYDFFERRASKKFKKDNADKIDNFNVFYDVAYEIFDNNIPFAKWINRVEQFSTFVRFAEKCFLYQNQSDPIFNDIAVYSEKENDEDKLFIKKENEYKIRYTFKTSNIIDITSENNNLGAFINNDINSDCNIGFINIVFIRSYGKGLCNEFNFISDEEPIYKDLSDEILMDNIRIKTAQNLKLVWNEVFNSLIPKLFRIEYFDMSTIRSNKWKV